jgi:hypothetical protein
MMILPLLDTGDRVFSFAPSSYVNQTTIPANSLTGFTHAAAVVADQAYWGTTKRYLLNTPYVFEQRTPVPLWETKAKGRDVEVETWGRDFLLYLQLDGGKAYVFKLFDAGQQFTVSFMTNIPASPTWDAPGTVSVTLYNTGDLEALIGGGFDSQATASHVYTFGVEGMTLYAAMNGVRFWEGTYYYRNTAGTVMYVGKNDEDGCRDTTVTFKPDSTRYSDMDNKIIDPRDWGFKSVQTTGSMSAGSPTLTVASSTGFAIGDKIIVATGGEAGAGLLGTKGVGGTWPAASYANEAALPSPSAFRAANGNTDAYAWLEDTGKVWIAFLSSGTPTWGNFTDAYASDDEAFFYFRNVAPRALIAYITNIVGNTITLDRNSVVATTNAEVYFDNTDVQYAAMGSIGASNLSSATFQWPAGTYAMSGRFFFGTNDYWTVRGDSRSTTVLKYPKGVPQIVIENSGEFASIRDFKVVGNFGTNYWCHPTTNGYYTYEHTLVVFGNYKTGGYIERVDFENTWLCYALQTRFDGYARDCTAVWNNGSSSEYVGWPMQTAYCTDTWMEDCSLTFDSVNPGMELFQADGGGIRSCTLVNGYVASNTSGGGYLMDELDIDLDYNASPSEDWWALGRQPAIEINTNIGGGALNPSLVNTGGEIRNPTMAVTKRSSNGFMRGGIGIQSSCPLMRVTGTHPAKPGAGQITMSDYEEGDVSTNWTHWTGVGSDATDTVISGIRVIGDAIPTDGFTSAGNIKAPDASTIQNCVADVIVKFTSVTNLVGTNGNINNTTYNAL